MQILTLGSLSMMRASLHSSFRFSSLAIAVGMIVATCSTQPHQSTAEVGQTLAQRSQCPTTSGGVRWVDADSAELTMIQQHGGLTVFAAEYPLPGPTEGLWSQWGQGIVAPDGRHFSAVGDHRGVDGNSHFFVYEPQSRSLNRFMDTNALIERPAGSWGFGKIHAQMVTDDCGTIWAATYWGSRRGITDYDGDHLISIDPLAGTISDEGVVSLGLGIPSMAFTPVGNRLAIEAVDPESRVGSVVARNSVDGGQSNHDDSEHVGFRSLGLTEEGSILYSVGGRRLMAWQPASDRTTLYTDDLPGDWLRAVTAPLDDGGFVGVTQDPPRLFRASPQGDITAMGDPGGYTTSLALDPMGRRVFWMANAHGGAWKDGAPIVSMDLETGEQQVLLSLRKSFASELGLLPGGTYSMVYDAGRLYVGVNASQLGDDSGFGTVVLVVIEGL